MVFSLYKTLNLVTLICFLYARLSAQNAYDDQGRLQQIGYPGGVEALYSYDVADRLIAVSFLNQKIEYVYDQVDNTLLKTIFPNGITTEYEYDKAKRVIAVFHKQSDKTLLLGFRYKFDGNGNRIYASKMTPNGSEETEYFYDKLNRLIAVQYPTGYEKYTYDALGNRLTKESASSRVKYEYDQDNRLNKADDIQFFYDERGNLIKKVKGDKMVEYVYDADNHLIQYQDDTHRISYTYDAEGHRLSKCVNGEITFYVNDNHSSIPQVLAELDANAIVKNIYIYGLSRLCQIQLPHLNSHLYLYDYPERNVVALADRKEQLLNCYSYLPFGTTKSSISTSNPFTFAGEHYEEETGLIYLRNRYYDPEIGRFLSPDPQWGKVLNPQSFNPYAYVENNPINFVDPLGLKSARFCAYAPGTITESCKSAVGHGFWVLTKNNGDVFTIGRYPKQPRFDDKIVPGTVSFEVPATDSQIDAIINSVSKGSYGLGILNNCIDGLERGLEILGIDHPSFNVLGVSAPTKTVMWIESLNGTDDFTKALEQDLKFIAEPDQFWPAARTLDTDIVGTINERDQLIKVSSPAGCVDYEYDEVGNLIGIKDGNGNETYLDYDENYNLSTVTDAEGGITRYRYNRFHCLTDIILPNESIYTK